MRPLRWMLVGSLVLGRTLPSDADEPKTSEDAQSARFERLLKQRPNDPVLHYNLGTVRYQHGRYDNAAESLSAAIASSGSSLQGRASYNLGNTHYRLGHAAEQTAPSQAADFYHNALEDYRLAIRQDPNDRDAKYNYELTEHRLKALQAQQQAQAQQQQAGQSGEPQQQHDASAGSPSEPQPAPSTESAQGAEQQQEGQQQEGQHAQAQPQQQPGRQGSEQQAQTATEPQNMSQQQALWILDTLKNEERGALVKERQGSAREADVEHDW